MNDLTVQSCDGEVTAGEMHAGVDDDTPRPG